MADAEGQAARLAATDQPEEESRATPSRAWFLPLTEWLCRRPLLVLVAGLLVAIVWGRVGIDYGVPNLFWHKDKPTQLLAGIGAAWLLGQISFVGYLLALEGKWVQDWSIPRYLGWTWAPLLLVLLLRALLPAGGDNLFATTFNDVPHWPFALGLGVGAGVAGGLLFALDRLHKLRKALAALLPLGATLLLALPRKLARRILAGSQNTAGTPIRKSTPANAGSHDDTPKARRHEAQAAFFTLLLVIYLALSFSPLAVVVFPALALCILLGLTIAVYGFIALRFPNTTYPILAALAVLAVLFNLAPDKHRFADLSTYYEDDAKKPIFKSKEYNDRKIKDIGLDNSTALKAWLQYYREHHAKDPKARPKLVVVAASGGGIRSAIWTTQVLTKLEEEVPGFFYRVRLITGASGGMLGTSYFTTHLDELQQFDKSHSFRAEGPESRAVSDMLAARIEKLRTLINLNRLKLGGLREVAQYWAFRDVPRYFWPRAYYRDRGWALEEAWQTNISLKLGRPFRELLRGEEEGWRPSLVFSPMLVEDGRRLFISNLNLVALGESKGALYLADSSKVEPDGTYSVSAVEFYRLFPEATNFKLSTAVRMSASFPFISPSTALPTNPPRRVVDAGYYDNYGVNVAALWIYDNRLWLKENTSGVVLIQIRDHDSQQTRQDLGREEELNPPSWWQQGLVELLTPIEGILEARDATMSFRSDEQLQALNGVLNEEGSDNKMFFTTFVIQCPVKAALSWYVTDSEFDSILGSVQGKGEATQELIQKNKNRLQGLKELLTPP